jgi:hypothetical protein
VSATGLLYAPFASLFLFSLLAIAILRPFNIKEWIIFLMGCLTPFYVLFSYFFLTDKLQEIASFIPKKFIAAITRPSFHTFVVDKITLIKLGFAVFIFLLGYLQLAFSRKRMLIQTRKYWSLLFIYLIIITVEIFLFPTANIESFIICLVPASAIVAVFFATPQRSLWMINLLFFVFLAIVVHTNWQLMEIK